MNKKMLIYRNYSGFGDWLMALSVIKMINIQYPNIDIYVNVRSRNVFGYRQESFLLPSIILESINSFDCDLRGREFFSVPITSLNNFDYVVPLEYKKYERKNFMDNMVSRFNRSTGLELRYDKDIKAQYVGDGDNTHPLGGKSYILIQACSKRKYMNKKWKDFGFKNMQEIVNALNNKIDFVQIGLESDHLLSGTVDKCLSGNLPDVYKYMINSKFFLGINGGLGVFAMVHNIKHYILCMDKNDFIWTDFENRVQLDGQLMSPSDVVEYLERYAGI